eukprot:Rmarinus@m.14135
MPSMPRAGKSLSAECIIGCQPACSKLTRENRKEIPKEKKRKEKRKNIQKPCFVSIFSYAFLIINAICVHCCFVLFVLFCLYILCCCCYYLYIYFHLYYGEGCYHQLSSFVVALFSF